MAIAHSHCIFAPFISLVVGLVQGYKSLRGNFLQTYRSLWGFEFVRICLHLTLNENVVTHGARPYMCNKILLIHFGFAWLCASDICIYVYKLDKYAEVSSRIVSSISSKLPISKHFDCKISFANSFPVFTLAPSLNWTFETAYFMTIRRCSPQATSFSRWRGNYRLKTIRIN